MGGKPDLVVMLNHAFKERDPTPWAEEGACKGMSPNIFFPGQGGHAMGISAYAKTVCEKCPVMLECRKYSLDNNERYGVWGGWGERERRIERLRRSRIRGIAADLFDELAETP